MESLRVVIFISAILNLVNAQASYVNYQPISYRPGPPDSNNNLNILKEFTKEFWNDKKGLSDRFNPEVEIGQASVIDPEKERNIIAKPVLINPTIWNDQKGLNYRFNPEVEIDQASVVNPEKERNITAKPVLINPTIWNDQKGLSYRFNPEVQIDQASVIYPEKERNIIQKPVLINPINVGNTLRRYDLKRIDSGDALKYVGIPQLNIKQAYIKSVAIPEKLGVLRQSQKRINNGNSVIGNNLALLPWNKVENSHNHISRTSFQIQHRKQTHSVSGNVGSTDFSNPPTILPQEERFEEIENTNKAPDLLKQPMDAIIEPPKPMLRVIDIPNLYAYSLKTDEQPKNFLSYRRRLNAPLEADSQVKGSSAELSPIDSIPIADVKNQEKRKPNNANQDATNIKEDLVTDFIINNFPSKDMANLIATAKTKEEKKKVLMAMKNYKIMTHALIDFIRYSNPVTGYINRLKLISENKHPGSGVSTSTLEEVFEDESKATINREPSEGKPKKVENTQDVNNAGFHVIHDHRTHVSDNLKLKKDENIKRTSEDQSDKGQVVVIPFGSEEINDQKEFNNTSNSLRKPLDSVDVEPIQPIEPIDPFGPLRQRKTKKIKTLKKEELETFMKNLQVHKKIDDAFCEKLKPNEAISVMESIIRDFIEDLSYKFDKHVIMNTAEFSVNRNLHYQRDSEQDCFYY